MAQHRPAAAHLGRAAASAGRTLVLAATSIALLAIGGVSAGAQSARPHGLAGAYLQARHAMLKNDAPRAALYFQKALRLSPNDPMLLNSAFYFTLMVGEVPEAARIAERLAPLAPGDRYARLSLLAEAMRAGRYDVAERLLTAEAGGAMAPLTRQMGLGWVAFAKGDAAAARDVFLNQPTSVDLDALDPADRAQAAAERDGVIEAFRRFGLQQVGLMEIARGDDAAAATALEQASEGPSALSARLALALGGVYRRLGRTEEAIARYDEVLKRDAHHPVVSAAREAAMRGAPAVPMVRDGAQGLATLFISVGRSLSGREPEEARRALYYAQISRYLDPTSDEARMVAAEQLVELGQYGLAEEIYDAVPTGSPYAEVARIAQAETLAREGEVEEALTILRKIAGDGSDRPALYLTLGGLERTQSRFGACVEAYERALTLIDDPNWRVWLNLGVCQERSGNWDGAEESFVKALALEPKQPDVLNHFGYGLVEQGRRLDEARQMIETAVAERPENGYIVDSLGWVLYRLGEFDEAVTHLEKAASLEPSEWVISDHLGDALWRVGRRLEAEFQWRRALSLKPDVEEKDRIGRKLKVGLDTVLREETSPETDHTTTTTAAQPIDG